ncbi:hypothetical protein ANRL3_01381 [Anaerolineae bacterium]|nr:hypothetical protein ANRL3_01381 [Anaerolineae bacterium]
MTPIIKALKPMIVAIPTMIPKTKSNRDQSAMIIIGVAFAVLIALNRRLSPRQVI